MNTAEKLKGIAPSLLVSCGVVGALALAAFQLWVLSGILVAIMTLVISAEFLLSIPNLKTPLKIKTPDGHDQPLHPSVRFFEDGWRGYRYWMAFTPYPTNAEPYRDRWESPCVVASQDGLNWQYPCGMAYLDDLTPQQINLKNYFSDTHLYYDEKKDSLVCCYRYVPGTSDHPCPVLFSKTTSDGVNWSTRTELHCCDEICELSPLSPAIVRERDGFRMWFVPFEKDPEQVYLASSADGVQWELQDRCVLEGNSEVKPWHIDCQLIDGTYYMVVYDLKQTISLWKSNDAVRFVYIKELLSVPQKNKAGCFYSNTLYRASLCKNECGYRLYFSSNDSRRFAVGVMEGENLNTMRIISAGNSYRIKDVLFDIGRKYTLIFRSVARFLRQE